LNICRANGGGAHQELFKLFNSDTASRGDEVSNGKKPILSSDYDRLGPVQVNLVLARILIKKRKVRKGIGIL
jgi:hypothetical protein